jgi:hypothetical protein
MANPALLGKLLPSPQIPPPLRDALQVAPLALYPLGTPEAERAQRDAAPRGDGRCRAPHSDR